MNKRPGCIAATELSVIFSGIEASELLTNVQLGGLSFGAQNGGSNEPPAYGLAYPMTCQRSNNFWPLTVTWVAVKSS